MDFVNHTALPAELLVSPMGTAEDGRKVRSGLVVAKATFDVSSDGVVTLNRSCPHPIHHQPVHGDQGLAPADIVPRQLPQLDAFVVGSAQAPEQRPVSELIVSLRVGVVQAQLLVMGDRRWVGSGDDAVASEPEPFLEMPLTWERAFGGGSDVWLDANTIVPAEDQLNPRGRGYDPRRLTDGMPQGFSCPPGFPRLEHEVVWLPNVEDPTDVVRTPRDWPLPAGWNAIPPEMGLLARAGTRAQLRDARRGCAVTPTPPADDEPLSAAHPDLRQPPPTGPLPFALDGVRSEGRWAGYIPFLQPQADYEIGERRGAVPLLASQVVFFPGQEQITVTYHYWFKFKAATEDARSMRLRGI